MATAKTVVTIALCCACVGGVAFAQESGTAGAEAGARPAAVDGEERAPPPDVGDEVVVRGQSFGVLRSQIELAEEVVYERFNEINSDDDFDIHCRMDVMTGSRLLRRFCEANFWRKAEADAGEETAYYLQGSAYAGNMQQYRGRQHYMNQLLRDEMRRLATEDEEFLGALMRLGEAHRALAEQQASWRSSGSASQQSVTPGTAGLAYDAKNIVDARVGRDRWTHVLTRRTFTFAHVFGEIRKIEVDCDTRKQELPHEIGVEWTIPDDWGQCTLSVDAAPETTFALYEFE